MDESALELGARALAALAVDYLIAFAELSFLRFFPARRGQEGSQRLAEPIPGPTTERFQRKAREHVLEWDRLTNVRREARMPPREVLPGEIPRDGSAFPCASSSSLRIAGCRLFSPVSDIQDRSRETGSRTRYREGRAE